MAKSSIVGDTWGATDLQARAGVVSWWWSVWFMEWALYAVVVVGALALQQRFPSVAVSVCYWLAVAWWVCHQVVGILTVCTISNLLSWEGLEMVFLLGVQGFVIALSAGLWRYVE